MTEKEYKAYLKGWKEGIKARDKQLAERFPANCGFLKATYFEHPKPPKNNQQDEH